MLGEKQVVKILLQQDDIDVNCHDSRGRTAAHFAAELRNSSIIQILHESGRFDLNAKDDKGFTPMDIATSKMSYEVITYLREILNLGNDEEEEDNDNEMDNDIDKNVGKPVLLDNKCTIFYSPEEDDFDINEKIKFLKGVQIHGAIYDRPNPPEDVEDNNYSLNDTDDFLKAEKLSNEVGAKYKLKSSGDENNDDNIDDNNDDNNIDTDTKGRRNIGYQNLNTEEEEEKTIDDLMNSYDPDDNETPRYGKNDSNEYIDGSNEFIVLNDPSDDKNISSGNDLEPKIDNLVDPDVEGRQNDELLEAERLIAQTAEDDENSLEKTEDFIEDEDMTNSFSGQQNKESNSNSNSQSQSQSASFNVSQTESQDQSQSQEGENNVSDNINGNYVTDHFDDEDNIDDEDNFNIEDEPIDQNKEQHDKTETETNTTNPD